jgi:translocation and assembly module TamA
MSRLIIRGEGGGSVVSEFSELPPSKRFFAGGDNSIRGYAYDSLGPEDEDGNVKGGKYLMVGSIEFEHRLKDNWSAAAFYDAGNAFDSLTDPFRHGAGFGIRWRSPVGPVRLDLAFPLGDADRSWRIHINIGPDL